MKLLPPELERRIPPLRAAEHHRDPLVVMKFFTPDSNWTWYVLEGSREDDDFIFFGLVDGFVAELGYYSLNELEAVRGPLGLPIERDLWWQSVPLSEVKALVGS
ncbi:MAG: DUF2958 domain-containing protein [Actinomycetota bacterium]